MTIMGLIFLVHLFVIALFWLIIIRTCAAYPKIEIGPFNLGDSFLRIIFENNFASGRTLSY